MERNKTLLIGPAKGLGALGGIHQLIKNLEEGGRDIFKSIGSCSDWRMMVAED